MICNVDVLGALARVCVVAVSFENTHRSWSSLSAFGSRLTPAIGATRELALGARQFMHRQAGLGGSVARAQHRRPALDGDGLEMLTGVAARASEPKRQPRWDLSSFNQIASTISIKFPGQICRRPRHRRFSTRFNGKRQIAI